MQISKLSGKTAAFSCASALALTVGVNAHAEDGQAASPQSTAAGEGDLFNDIVVTARRREENSQNVPVAVVALSGDDLIKMNVSSLDDLPRVAPGLTVTPSALGGTRPVYQIRGQRAAATRVTTDPAIVVYFAEVGSSRAAGSAQSMFDIQSVQVLKGPQGTLFGRNTTGGAILITPAAPKDEFEGYIGGSIGNYNKASVEGVLNVPLGDQFQVRLAVKVNRRDGFFENVAQPGREAFDDNNQSYRATLRFQPSSDITSDTIGTIFHSDVVGFQAKLFHVNPVGVPAPSLVPLITGAVAGSNALGFYEYSNPFAASNVDTTRSIQNNTTVELNDTLTLKNIIGYKRIKNNFTNFADGSTAGLLNAVGYYRGTQFSEEIQLQGETGSFDFLIGGFYSTESGRDLTENISFGGPGSYTDYDGKNNSLSGFVHASIDLGGGISVNAGGRITHDTREAISHQRQDRTPPICLATGTAVVITDIDDLSQCSVTTNASFTEPTWNLGVNYQITPDNLLYVAHRHGYRSGAATTSQAPNLRPEKVNDIEIGSKNDFRIGDVPVRFNLIGYYGAYTDLQRNIAVLVGGAAVTQDRNAAKAKVYGLETELDIKFSDVLSLHANYALTKAKYDSYNNTITTAGGPVVVDNSGATFSYTPEHALSATATINAPIKESLGRPSISATYTYQSSFQTTDSNSPNCGPGGIEKWCLNSVAKVSGFGLVNTRIDWSDFMGSPVDLGFFVTNLTNKKYIAGTYGLVNVLGFASEWPGAPRMFGLEAKVRFGGAVN
ncbi:MAG: TonB-dependent receptor [Parasphingorhabdus sp.]